MMRINNYVNVSMMENCVGVSGVYAGGMLLLDRARSALEHPAINWACLVGMSNDFCVQCLDTITTLLDASYT